MGKTSDNPGEGPSTNGQNSLLQNRRGRAGQGKSEDPSQPAGAQGGVRAQYRVVSGLGFRDIKRRH